MSRISLPVILNEPMTILQKCCEITGNLDLIREAVSYKQTVKNLNLESEETKSITSEET